MNMKKPILIPTAISSLRLIALPIFLYLFNTANISACLALMTFCAATDFFDGYAARTLNVISKFGAYYDAATDFALMFGAYTIFTFNGYYPTWLLLLIAASFAQFLATSCIAKKFYDLVGKYIGSALYIGVALTLLWPIEPVFLFVQYAFAGFFVVSLVSRIISLTRGNHPKDSKEKS